MQSFWNWFLHFIHNRLKCRCRHVLWIFVITWTMTRSTTTNVINKINKIGRGITPCGILWIAAARRFICIRCFHVSWRYEGIVVVHTLIHTTTVLHRFGIYNGFATHFLDMEYWLAGWLVRLKKRSARSSCWQDQCKKSIASVVYKSFLPDNLNSPLYGRFLLARGWNVFLDEKSSRSSSWSVTTIVKISKPTSY